MQNLMNERYGNIKNIATPSGTLEIHYLEVH